MSLVDILLTCQLLIQFLDHFTQAKYDSCRLSLQQIAGRNQALHVSKQYIGLTIQYLLEETMFDTLLDCQIDGWSGWDSHVRGVFIHRFLKSVQDTYPQNQAKIAFESINQSNSFKTINSMFLNRVLNHNASTLFLKLPSALQPSNLIQFLQAQPESQFKKIQPFLIDFQPLIIKT